MNIPLCKMSDANCMLRIFLFFKAVVVMSQLFAFRAITSLLKKLAFLEKA